MRITVAEIDWPIHVDDSYLVDRPRIRHWLIVLDDGDWLSGEDGLIDTEGGGHDGDDADVGGDLVTDWNESAENFFIMADLIDDFRLDKVYDEKL